MAEPAKQTDPVFHEGQELRIRLLAVAVRLFKEKGCRGQDSILPGTGKTPEGLVNDTIVRLLKSGKWHPGSGGPDIFPYAKVTLDHLFIDLLRKLESTNSVSIDSAEADKFLKFTNPVDAPSPLEAIVSRETIDWIRRQCGADKMALAYVDAVVNGATTREEIAESMGVTPQEVTNIQRRLQYKLHKMEQMMWESKDRL